MIRDYGCFSRNVTQSHKKEKGKIPHKSIDKRQGNRYNVKNEDVLRIAERPSFVIAAREMGNVPTRMSI